MDENVGPEAKKLFEEAQTMLKKVRCDSCCLSLGGDGRCKEGWCLGVSVYCDESG